MRYVLLLLAALLIPVNVARADVSISIGINVPTYPTLVRVPGYPAYYDPRIDGNYFFYDGLYWVYWDDQWYSSSWYNGPWWFADPYYVPVAILCIPVRYYVHRPHYFRHWHDDEPPHWGEHWGHDWERRRPGWDRWDRHSAPEPAPLPSYQRDYSGDRYPRDVSRQQRIRADNYRFEPRERVSRQHFERETQRAQSDPGTRVQRDARPDRDSQVIREPRPGRVEREPRQPTSRTQPFERREPAAPDRSERNGRADRQVGRDRDLSRERSSPRQDSPREERSPREQRAPRQDFSRDQQTARERPEPDRSRQAASGGSNGDRPPRSGRNRDEQRDQERDRDKR